MTNPYLLLRTHEHENSFYLWHLGKHKQFEEQFDLVMEDEKSNSISKYPNET